MKILVVSHFQNDNSPCAVFVHDQLKSFLNAGLRVCVVVPVPFGKRDFFGYRFLPIVRKEKIDNIDYCFFRYFSFSNYGERRMNALSAIAFLYLFLFRTIFSFHPDVVHAHTIGIDSQIGAWIKKKIKCPLVITTHGSDTSIPFKEGKYKHIQQRCDNADAMVCVGTKLRECLIHSGVSNKIYVISNGFNSEYLINNSNKRPYSLIQVGNLVPSKRNDVTIKAFAKVLENYPSAKLTVVGDGPEKERLIMLCEELNLEEAVEFVGRVSNEKVLEMMARSEFFVMVSSPEGFGIVYLEAMGSGCVTFAAENEGISDVIVSDENGVLLPIDRPDMIAAKILWLIANPHKKESIAAKGKESAMLYTWSCNANKYKKLFQELIEYNES